MASSWPMRTWAAAGGALLVLVLLLAGGLMRMREHVLDVTVLLDTAMAVTNNDTDSDLHNGTAALQRWDVACNADGGCAWRVLQERQAWPPAVLCVERGERWHRNSSAPTVLTSESVVRAYLAGPDVFAAMPVWWDAAQGRPCVLGVRRAPQAAAATSTRSGGPGDTAAADAAHHMIFVLEYDNATVSLQPGPNQPTLRDEIAHGRDNPVLLVLPAVAPPSPAADLELPWGWWHPGPRFPLALKCIPSKTFSKCDGRPFGLLSHPPLSSVQFPDQSWVWAEPLSSKLLGPVDRPWPQCRQRFELYNVGDSVTGQLTTLTNFTRLQGNDACSSRPLPETLPAVHFHRVYQLQSEADLQLYLNVTMRPWESLIDLRATPVLVLSSGLWNLKDQSTLPRFRVQLQSLLDQIEARSTFPRAVFATAAALHVMHKPSILDKVRLTSTRVAAINLVVRDLFASRKYKRIALLDVSAPSVGAPWGTRPVDSIHYCQQMFYTRLAMLLRFLCEAQT